MSTPRFFYAVVADYGEYDERETWAVAVYATRKQAEAHVAAGLAEISAWEAFKRARPRWYLSEDARISVYTGRKMNLVDDYRVDSVECRLVVPTSADPVAVEVGE